MSHTQHPDESGIVPDDHLLVRPYVAPSGRPPQSTAPAWPQAGPLAFPGPARGPVTGGSAPTPPPADRRDADSATGRGRGRGRGGRSRLPAAVLTLLALFAVGALVLVLLPAGPDPRPPRAEPPADLSVPVLPGGPGADDEEPGPTASVRSAAPSPTAPAASDTPASQSPKPTPPPSPSAPSPAGGSATLRMGDSGPEVRSLQEMLHGQGFTYVSVTGVYDAQTKRGVSQLQRDRSIKGDPPGVYGPATRAAME
ncbi:peptidoglycan-binding protein [Streptomyces sp. NPDC059949]|uniref:peptidoglycan-binding domain-containing protein n=1 Tax=Streptomyces sp. NPDC059949 TaxID=3347013 RepID=UPI00364F00E3